MFGGSASSPKDKVDSSTPSSTGVAFKTGASDGAACGRKKRDPSPSNSSNSTASDANNNNNNKQKKEGGGESLKRKPSSVSRAAALFTSAKNTLNLSSLRDSLKEQPQTAQTPIQSLQSMDPALAVPQGPYNNSAGKSLPMAHSSFRVGVTEDRNKKCRRTMEDTHAYLYNFLGNPAPSKLEESSEPNAPESPVPEDATQMIETDNGYFAIFDGHAGTFAAEWCGKKLHLILEDIFRKNPDAPVPELLDQAFTSVDQHLANLPLKNSGCTAIAAVLRWEDRPCTTTANADTAAVGTGGTDEEQEQTNNSETPSQTKPKPSSASASDTASTASGEGANPSRSRILYSANVGDARIILCRKGKALRLSYDHKGSDENEGKRITNAGGLILNNRVNGVLAVTRALGDSYMKDLVTGHPYTTETVILPDEDEFLILACDGLWDVCSDQEAVDLIYDIHDPQAASKFLVDHALSRFSTDNLSIMVVRFDTKATENALKKAPPAPADATNAEPPPSKNLQRVSEADRIVEIARQNASESDEATEGEAGAQAAFFARAMEQDIEESGPEISLPNEDQVMSSPTDPDKTSNPG